MIKYYNNYEAHNRRYGLSIQCYSNGLCAIIHVELAD